MIDIIYLFEVPPKKIQTCTYMTIGWKITIILSIIIATLIWAHLYIVKPKFLTNPMATMGG